MGAPEIQRIIDEAATGIANSMSMPQAKTTTIDKEYGQATTRREYKVKFFNLIDDESALAYSEFMTDLINKKGVKIVREDKSWTPEGELLRVVDYLEEVPV